MIDQDDTERALLYLAESAKPFAEARGRRVWLEEKRKVIKADLFSSAPPGSIAEREAWAYGQGEYSKHLDQLRDAVTAEETMRALRAAAEARIEVWRSQESSRRAANIR